MDRRLIPGKVQGLFSKLRCEEVSSNPIPWSSIGRSMIQQGGHRRRPAGPYTPARWRPLLLPPSSSEFAVFLFPSTKSKTETMGRSKKTSRAHLGACFGPGEDRELAPRWRAGAARARSKNARFRTARAWFCDLDAKGSLLRCLGVL